MLKSDCTTMTALERRACTPDGGELGGGEEEEIGCERCNFGGLYLDEHAMVRDEAYTDLKSSEGSTKSSTGSWRFGDRSGQKRGEKAACYFRRESISGREKI